MLKAISDVPLLLSWVLHKGVLVHRVEVEVLRHGVHPLHLLLPVHLEPLFKVYAQVLAFLSKCHIGPLIRVKVARAQWVSS